MTTPSVPGEPTGASGEPQTLDEIAAAFKQSVKVTEEKEGVKLSPVQQRVRRAKEKPPAPVPVWSPERIGMIPVYLHDAIFAAYDMPPLEPEEEKSLSETTAYYLTERWPEGAKYEPEARMLAELSGLWVPRIMAKRQELKEQEVVEPSTGAARKGSWPEPEPIE